jgi:hypothetical protein
MNKRKEYHKEDPIRDATILALGDLIEPLLELMFDIGITVSELNTTVRTRAVQAASKRVFRASGRSSKSRVAAITGLPRSEIAKILRPAHAENKKTRSQHVLRRVLEVWFDQRKCAPKDGIPEVLPIFGNRLSFQAIVEKYGGGIPVRAVLDELLQIGVVELLPDQRVRVKSRMARTGDFTEQSIAIFGKKARDVLQTLANEARHRSETRFEATTSVIFRDVEGALRATNAIAAQTQSFIDESSAVLKGARRNGSDVEQESSNYCVGVTAYCFRQRLQNSIETSVGTKLKVVRKNLRRKK